MSGLRTRLARAILMRLSLHAERQWTCDDLADAVLAVLASPSDADVERVARELINEGAVYTWMADGLARAAIRALVGESKT